MGRSVSLLCVRLCVMATAALLLCAVFAQVHAENLDNYGLKPMESGSDDGNYGLVPVPGAPSNPPAAPSGGFTPVPQQRMAAAPQAQPAQYQPATPYSPPSPAGVAYGYRPELRPSAPAYPQTPTYPSATNLPGAAYAYAPPAYGTRANPDYVLGTGDKIKLTVFGETDLSGDFTIDGSGNLALPLVGQVRGAGYTASQLEGAIAGAFSQGYLKAPRVSVEVSTYRPFYIIGAVNRPGQYPYVDHMNAMNAIALAGGFAPTAVESVVFLRREGSNQEVEVPVDSTTEVRPGDVIKVHNTLFSDITSWIAPVSGVAASAATAAIIQ